MTDADRLRAAADEIDRGGPPGWCACSMERTTAALLRAVADDLEIGLYIVGAESPAAAMALAKTILGDTDD